MLNQNIPDIWPTQLKKEDLDLCTLLFSWFLCPVFYASLTLYGLLDIPM